MNTDKYLDRVQVVFEAISENRYLKSISKAMVMTIPAMMAGAITVLIGNLPFEGYQAFLADTGLGNILRLPNMFTVEIIALLVAYFVGNNIASSFDLDGNMAGVTSLVAFLMLTPLTEFDVTGEGNLANYISYDWIGSRGMFVAILVGVLIGRLYALFIIKKIYIRMPDTVPSFVEKSFAAVIPFFLLVVLAAILSWLFSLTPQGHVHEVVYNILQVPLQGLGGSIGGVIVAYIAMNIFWWFGIHGKALVFAIVAPIWASLGAENLAATSAGQTPPNMIDMGFTTIFFEIGGAAGAVLGLAILFTFFAKSKRYRSTGRLTIIPTFFGINEPITFGTPVVLNPTFLIPTIVAPLVTGVMGYVSILIGFVPRMTGASLPTGVPTFVNAFILGGWRAAVVQVLAVLVSVAIYYPFFRAADKQALEEELKEPNEEEQDVDSEEITDSQTATV